MTFFCFLKKIDIPLVLKTQYGDWKEGTQDRVKAKNTTISTYKNIGKHE